MGKRMKEKFFTIVMMSSLLGIYSASIYLFSLDKIDDNLHNDDSSRSLYPMEASSEDLNKILGAVKLQAKEPPVAATNLPIPGADCSVSLNDILTDNSSEFDEEISRCLRSSYASTTRE